MMARQKRRKKPVTKGWKKVKITSASVIGVGLGLLLVGIGLYAALEKGEYGGFYVVALGVVFTAAVCWGVIRRR